MAFETNMTALDFRGNQVGIHLVGMPDSCPRCHKHINPALRVSTVAEARGISQVVYQCTNEACQEAFFANYRFKGTMDAGRRRIYDYAGSAPLKAVPSVFPPDVAAVSPNFVEIYNQAVAAEAHGLDQVVGIALRKSVEFLIKDFAIHEHPSDADAIRSSLLGPCIDRWVTDPMVKQVAKRAVWLGNDETHYVRKWETKDVSDLKTLVRLTVNWIDSMMTTKRYLSEMTAAGPSTYAPPASL